jgi:hypothetical protein
LTKIIFLQAGKKEIKTDGTGVGGLQCFLLSFERRLGKSSSSSQRKRVKI